MIGTSAISTGVILVLTGLWSVLTNRDIIRMIIGFSIFDLGIHIIMLSIGYINGGTAPIINDAVPMSEAVNLVVDPVPSALVLTAIVIGLGVTAVMLSFAVRIHKAHKTLMIDKLTDSK